MLSLEFDAGTDFDGYTDWPLFQFDKLIIGISGEEYVLDTRYTFQDAEVANGRIHVRADGCLLSKELIASEDDSFSEKETLDLLRDEELNIYVSLGGQYEDEPWDYETYNLRIVLSAIEPNHYLFTLGEREDRVNKRMLYDEDVIAGYDPPSDSVTLNIASFEMN